jgi:hypothetical protein
MICNTLRIEIMKRNKTLMLQWIAWLCITFFSCSGIEEGLSIAGYGHEDSIETRADLIEYTINVETAGTLDSLVEAGNYADAQKLIVTGNITFEDVNYVDVNMRTVEILDLSGTAYNEDYISGTFLSDSTRIKDISLPGNITSISGYSIYDGELKDYFPFKCTSLTNITLPQGVTRIGGCAFEGCSSLTSINIPEGVTEIGSSAFNGCSSLTSINIPEGVTEIGDSAFEDCSSLTSITLPKSLTNIDSGAFWKCSSLTCINIPESVTNIGWIAFNGCSSLTSITLPKSLTSIHSGAFANCSSLVSINIPEGVTSISNDVFANCSSLVSITLPESLTSFEIRAFENCSSLTSINIPGSVTYIAEYAFNGCSSLTNINIAEGVTSIQERAFQNCSSLASVILPQSLTSIGSLAFDGCSSLTNINIPKGVTNIRSFAFYGCSSLTSINIPEGVTDLYATFWGCSSLTNVTLPTTMTSIGYSAFRDCSSLTCISIPDSVTYIESFAFNGCNSLTQITIPESVTYIGYSNLYGCSSLKTIIWNTSCPLEDDQFYDYESGRITSLSGRLILYSAEDITSSVGNDKHTTTAKKVVFTKYFSPWDDNTWYTISLPFKPTQISHEEKGTIAPFDSDIEGAKNFWLRELTSNGYQDVTEIEANHAYIIAMPTNTGYPENFRLGGTVTFSAEDVTLTWEPVASEGSSYTMYPTFDIVKKAMDIYALNSKYWVDGYGEGGRVFVRGAMDVNPYEAYIKYNDGGATMRSVLPITDSKRTAVRGSNDASSRGAYGHQKPRKEDM